MSQEVYHVCTAELMCPMKEPFTGAAFALDGCCDRPCCKHTVPVGQAAMWQADYAELLAHLTKACTMAWLPPRGNSRQQSGRYHSLNMNATSAAMVPSAGRPAASSHASLPQQLAAAFLECLKAAAVIDHRPCHVRLNIV